MEKWLRSTDEHELYNLKNVENISIKQNNNEFKLVISYFNGREYEIRLECENIKEAEKIFKNIQIYIELPKSSIIDIPICKEGILYWFKMQIVCHLCVTVVSG